MPRSSGHSLTDAERAAFEWSREKRAVSRGRSKRSASEEGSYSRYRRRSRYDDSSDSDHPRDPFNPLKLAYQGKRARKYHRGKSRSRSRSRERRSPRQWAHDLYDDSELRVAEESRYNRDRSDRDITRYELDTRRGSWRSKAGGVYIPPDDDQSVDDDIYSDYRPRRNSSTGRSSYRSRSYERPDPVYTLD
ncbi:hypothetical protein BBOV_I002860 [Babesia bovis T2Bo]|uniref:Uncharacterized protein n=1 Tax=Babesia bovis TaxID=5865 RepID=A7AWE0_BABBO|nr:hypothetical protein BBOV_I002860 [Babesia bovis T2Bo]EDO05368.1 hypothetical protein BBOV_I002860 [Babesia bovis T2Bo]|eukprot:XP_001608936.1 hypothetical protein [Babesia bovis T2Bo]